MKCLECKEKMKCNLCGKTILCKEKIIVKNEMTKSELNICKERYESVFLKSNAEYVEFDVVKNCSLKIK